MKKSAITDMSFVPYRAFGKIEEVISRKTNKTATLKKSRIV